MSGEFLEDVDEMGGSGCVPSLELHRSQHDYVTCLIGMQRGEQFTVCAHTAIQNITSVIAEERLSNSTHHYDSRHQGT